MHNAAACVQVTQLPSSKLPSMRVVRGGLPRGAAVIVEPLGSGISTLATLSQIHDDTEGSSTIVSVATPADSDVIAKLLAVMVPCTPQPGHGSSPTGGPGPVHCHAPQPGTHAAVAEQAYSQSVGVHQWRQSQATDWQSGWEEGIRSTHEPPWAASLTVALAPQGKEVGEEVGEGAHERWGGSVPMNPSADVDGLVSGDLQGLRVSSPHKGTSAGACLPSGSLGVQADPVDSETHFSEGGANFVDVRSSPLLGFVALFV
jgi:hypothetical protein